jgi:hypothetical protein
MGATESGDNGPVFSFSLVKLDDQMWKFGRIEEDHIAYIHGNNNTKCWEIELPLVLVAVPFPVFIAKHHDAGVECVVVV